MSDERHPAMTLRMMLAEIAPGKAAALWGTPEVIAVMNQHYAETILAAKAEERESAALYVESMSDALYEKVDVTGVNGRDDAFGAWIVANVADAIRKRGGE